MSNAKHCESQRHSHSQSARRQQSCSCSCSINTNSIHSYQLLLALAALLMPLTLARHLHDQLPLGLAYDDADSSSASASLDSSNSLPAWHANPFYGLAQSFGDASYDSDASSSGSSANSANSGSSASGSIDAESDSSFEQMTQTAMKAVMRELRRQRIRHRRSHMLTYFVRAQQQPDAAPEWENPCGGVYQPDHMQPKEMDSSARTNKRKYLKALRNNTRSELAAISNDANLDYGDIQAWQREYKFLPNMTRPTKVKLQFWYSDVQTFVGSFAYLGKAHYKYQKEHQLPLGKATEELHKLLVSARRVLCEIETTINASYPYSNAAKLSQVSKAEMRESLKFYTPADGSKEADKRDLKFTKQLYYQYLDNMWKSLRRALGKHQRSSSEHRQHSSSAASSRQSAYEVASGRNPARSDN
ncbi:uncharacterized protein LOC111593017 [Drosophila hydei]|uniref:Uncharacterized protein LOC111593017 n=1 Tax=Drosophila hydei TaxID=7224 RepID=A0A6J1L4F2_DROHY|nr:uncharacterized protein LOC111593017 [Drosophila hydei]